MKRLFAAVLAGICLLCGCAAGPNLSVEVLTGERDFGYFSAAAPAAEDAQRGQTLLAQTLELYPGGFVEQLGTVEILLAGKLTGTDGYQHGSYAGFTQRTEDGWLMVLDVTACDAGTIHHELAHILDGLLTDAGALTEEMWMEYCPEGFVYGEGTWAQYPDFFTDEYAMQNIREDRARLFETAVQKGEGAFGDSPALWLKLNCFAEAIRSRFDTAGWPERTIWELALG